MDNVCLADVKFPVGYESFHKDQAINFHLNRWYSLGYWTRSDAERVGRLIKGKKGQVAVFVQLAEEMESEERLLAAAIAYRGAEFFTHPHDSEKLRLYKLFSDMFYQAVQGGNFEELSIPYKEGVLPALRFGAGESKGTILLHGGLDSFMEEFLSVASYLVASGYEVILFEGPGQGAALRHSSLYMTHEWEHPVSAVIDFLEFEDITLIGLSLGGYLALRAAAFDSRIKRVVAFDVFIYDQHGSGLQGSIYQLFLKYPSLYNWVAGTAMHINFAADLLISQWMYITNSETPAQWIKGIQDYSVCDIADLVKQDVLLLAGEEDHVIPLKEFYNNQNGLTNARSVTGRIFTEQEHAQNHCQVGNLKLALDVITNWIDSKSEV